MANEDLQALADDLGKVASTPPPDRRHLYLDIASRLVAVAFAAFVWWQANGHLSNLQKLQGLERLIQQVAPVDAEEIPAHVREHDDTHLGVVRRAFVVAPVGSK